MTATACHSTWRQVIGQPLKSGGKKESKCYYGSVKFDVHCIPRLISAKRFDSELNGLLKGTSTLPESARESESARPGRGGRGAEHWPGQPRSPGVDASGLSAGGSAVTVLELAAGPLKVVMPVRQWRSGFNSKVAATPTWTADSESAGCLSWRRPRRRSRCAGLRLAVAEY